MQLLTTATLLSLLFLATSAHPIERDNRAGAAIAIDPSLVPLFSIQTGSGVGANGVPIPTNCPPARDDFIAKLGANVAAGNVLGIPLAFNNGATVQDIATAKQRATAMIITLQNFSGKEGVGCPGTSTPELINQQNTGVQSPSYE